MNKKLLFKIIILSSVFCLLSSAFAHASIAIKLVGVNPSKDEVKKVILKAYLPREIKPEDVIYKDDLQVKYDQQQGSYYVYGEYEVEPGEIIEKEVEMDDVWVIPNKEIETLRLEIDKTFELLENTDFKERASFLKEGIDTKLNIIIEKQRITTANPQDHISDYRKNLELLKAIKEDLGLARGFLAQAKPFSAVAVWKLFFIIVGFLGFLGLTLYFVWQRQASAVTVTSSFDEKPKAKEEEVSKPQTRKKEEQKETEVDDIEKIMENDE